MAIDTLQQGAVTVVRPSGPLSGDESVAFRTLAGEAFRASGGRFVADMTAVSFVDSQALEALADLSEQALKNGQSLKLCGENETVRQAMELTELIEQFEHFADSAAAVRSFL